MSFVEMPEGARLCCPWTTHFPGTSGHESVLQASFSLGSPEVHQRTCLLVHLNAPRQV